MEQLHITDETLHPDWETAFADCKTTTSGLSYEEYTGTLDQPPTDQREHKLIRLPNNLVAICTSDPNAIMAAARISVGVGKFAEPAAVPELAHLLEHVITM
ncbi:metalloprotease, partial [Coemansia sp. RSA 353]